MSLKASFSKQSLSESDSSNMQAAFDPSSFIENKRKISVIDFANSRSELESGKVEILGSFIFWMQHIKKINSGTEKELNSFFEEFKKIKF